MLEIKESGRSAIDAKIKIEIIPQCGQLEWCAPIECAYLGENKLEALEGLKKTIIAAMPKIQKLLENELLRIDKEIAHAQNN